MDFQTREVMPMRDSNSKDFVSTLRDLTAELLLNSYSRTNPRLRFVNRTVDGEGDDGHASLPLVGETKLEEFLELEISVALFLSHTIVEPAMHEQFGGEVFADGKIKGVFPVCIHFLVAGEGVNMA